MDAETLAIGGRHSADRPVKRRRPGQPFDKRTRLGRRAVELLRIFRARIGEAAADPIVGVHIEKAARLTAYAEQLAARALNSDPGVSADDVIRAARASDLALRRLHLDHYKPQPAGPTFSDLVRAERAS